MNAVIKGAKAGSGESRKAVIAPDSAQSVTKIKILYGLSEGEVEGLANGLQSVYLEETPLQNPAGGSNFEVIADFRHGTNDQPHIEGFPDISSESSINVELKSDTPWVRSISNMDIDAVRIRLKWGPLREQNADNGDVNGITIKYAIDLQTDGSTWAEVLNTQISDKTSTNYERSHRIDLPRASTGWTIRVRRLTPNSASEYISDKMYVDAMTEVIDLKFSYPNTALLGLQYDAEAFSNVAKVAVDLKGIKLQVPSNYDPVSRTYTGMWDGTFKRAYTNNPAWIYYDLCTAKRYALGGRLTSAMLDKWSLYRLAQYCDQMVDDGKGGQEPRFTCNVYLQTTEDAYSILGKLAGVFRAISYWDGNSIVCDADIPQDTYFTYTRANVVDGIFEYSGTRARDRHTVAKVAWDNPTNHYKTEYAYVRDEPAIAKLGVRIAEIDAWGCTSEGQAQRAGLWALKSEQLETRTVSFKVGLDGYIPQPGKVIEIADELFSGRANGGRISAVSADRKVITIDRDNVVCRAGDRLVVNGEDGKAQARVVSSKIGRLITVTVPFDSVAAQNVWAVDAQDLKTMKFRVMSITQDEKHQFSITALQYESAKYDAIDYGAFIDERPISIINPTIQAPVASVAITSETMVQQGLSVETMIIAWPQAQGATKYQVEWRKDDGSWIKLPVTGNNSVEVAGIYAGNYQARVTAINAFDIASLPTYSILTALEGKIGQPPALASLIATGILFGYRLDWNFPATGALDTAYTEIEIASTANGTNAAPLGLFAYPTDTHVIQGMQPNLTRFFRGRLIDRIGNIGPWSAWTGATTSADAAAVLEILSGKITETQLHQDLQTKIDKIDTIAGLDGDIGNLIDNVAAAQTEVDQLNTALAQETQARILAVNDLDDGLTQEITDRQSGDTANLNALNNYKTSNDAALANVQQQVSTAVTATTANTQAVQALDSRVAIAEGNATTAKTNAASALTKAETATTQAGSAASLAQQASAIANQASDTADTASQTAATALSTANTAATQSDANATQINAITVSLGTKASAGALSQTDAKVAEIDGRVTANTSKVDGVYAQVNPSMIGSASELIGSESGYAGTWSLLTAQIEADAALSQRIDVTTAKITGNEAAIQTESTARADADVALATQINTVQSQVENSKALIWSEQQARTDADSALATRIDTLQAQVSNDLQQNIATIQTELDVLADADSSLAMRVDTVQSSTATAQTTADDALAEANTATQNIATIQTKVSTLTTQQTATANQVSTLQTTVGNNTASIQEVSESVDGLYSQKFIKLDVNGKVAGWGGANTGKESNFIMNFDSFAIGSGKSTAYYPFIFRTTAYTDPTTGTVFPIGAYLKSVFIDYASIKTSNIADLAVDTAKIKDAAITTAKVQDAAIGTAKIGDAAITTAKIGNLAVDTLKIKDQAVTLAVAAQAVNTLSITCEGGKVRVDVGVSGSYSMDQQYNFYISVRLKRNGTVLATWHFMHARTFYSDPNMVYYVDVAAACPAFIDNPGVGTHTYTVEFGTMGNYFQPFPQGTAPTNGTAVYGGGTTSIVLTETKK
jgi:predicted phage tail protein